MAGEIQNKQLWRGLNNIGQSDWIKAAPVLGIDVVRSNKGTSHFINLRDPEIDPDDIRGLVSTLTPNSHRQANEKIFKKVLGFCKGKGKSEDDIWVALGML